MDSKDIFLSTEGDNYFKRNKDVFDSSFITRAMNGYENFMIKNNIKPKKILEIGCCSGYNLIYLNKKFGCKGYGIEPSKEAVLYGNEICKREKFEVELLQGTADICPFEDEIFDIVLVGFCLFWVDRKYLMRAIAEIDRVLKPGGYVFMEDFDTTLPYKRINKHNKEAFTYKMDYTKFFLANPQYFLCEKETYSHAAQQFSLDIQERVSAFILYKEKLEDAYIF